MPADETPDEALDTFSAAAGGGETIPLPGSTPLEGADGWAPTAAEPEALPPPGPLDVPAAIEATGRYRPLGVLGRGGMGEVWRVRDLELGRRVALKVVRPDRAGSTLEVRLGEEAQVTAQLEHPAIVPVYDVGALPGGARYYTMREVAGDTLAARIGDWHADGGADPTTWLRLVDLVRRAAEAVGLAHARGVLHRDLKPANILVGDHGEVFVMDWGLVKVLGTSSDGAAAPVVSARSESGDHATRMGQVTGTPGYMSPEQARGEVDALTPATDVFGLGAVLYQLLTNRLIPRPLPQDDPALAGARARGCLPADLEALVRRALAPDPADRHPDAAAVADALGAWLDGARGAARAAAAADDAEAGFADLTAAEEARATWALRCLLDAEGQARAAALLPHDPTTAAALAALDEAVLRPHGAGRVQLVDPGLVRSWPRLARLAEDLQGRRAHARLRDAAAQVDDGAPLQRVLLGPDELADVEAWRARTRAWLDPGMRAVLDASTAALAAQARRQRALRWGAVAALAAAVAVFAVLYVRAEQARADTAAALEQAEAALAMDIGREHEALATARARQALGGGELPGSVQRMARSGVSRHIVDVGGGVLWRVDWSPDSRRLALSRNDGGVSIVDVETGTSRTVPLFAARATGAYWLDDRRLVAFSYLTDEAVLVDADTGEVRRNGLPEGQPVEVLRLSDGALGVWRDGALQFLGPDGDVLDQIAHPVQLVSGKAALDGERVVTLGADTVVRAYALPSGALEVAVGPLPQGDFFQVADNGLAAVVYTVGGRAWLIDLEAGQVVADLREAHGGSWQPQECTFSDDATLLACAEEGGHLRLVEVATGALRFRRALEVGELWSARISPDNLRVAAGGTDGAVRILDTRTGAVIETLRGHASDIKGIAWSPDGLRLGVALGSGRAELWSPASHRMRPVPDCPAPFTAPNRAVQWGGGVLLLDPLLRGCLVDAAGATTPVGEPGDQVRLVGAGPDALVTLEAGSRVVRRSADGGPPEVIDQTPPGTQSYTASSGRAWAWARDGRVYLRQEGVSWTPLAQHNDRKAHIWNAPSVDRLLTREQGRERLRLLDATSGAEIAAISGQHFNPTNPHSVWVAPDRDLLVTASLTGRLQRWSLATGQPTGAWQDPDATASSTIRGDREMLVAASRTGVLRGFSLDEPGEPRWTLPMDSILHHPQLRGDLGSVASLSGGVALFDVEDGRLRHWAPGLFPNVWFAGDWLLAAIDHLKGPPVLWSIAGLDEDRARTNLRVCQESGAVVAVVPFPDDDTVWAPEEACAVDPAIGATAP